MRLFALLALALATLFAPLALAQDAGPSAPAAPSSTLAPTAPPAVSAAPARGPTPTATPRPWTPEAPAPEAVMKARATPRRAIAGFLRAGSAGDFARGADFLDLRAIARERRAKEGPELAEKLYRVITWRVAIDPDAYPDDPEGETQRVLIDSVDLDGATTEITLVPVKIGGEIAWQFSKETVANVRALYDLNERRWLEERVPASLRSGAFLGLAPWQWIGVALLIGAAFLVSWIVGRSGTWFALRALARAPTWMRSLARAWSRPSEVALFAVTMTLAVPYLVLPKKAFDVVGYLVTSLYVLAVAWALIAALRVGTAGYLAALPQDEEHEIANRGLRTRLAMVRRIGTVIIGIVAIGIALLQFDVVRNVGLSLLASAGIAGVLVGFAAQRTLGGIISGIEISITQPLRMGDLVTIEGNEGIVERIYFTYVVVRLADDRRLIVPVQQVMSRSFENLTLTGADLLVLVDVFVDYETPIDALRDEFVRLCKEQSEWDGRRASVMVVECTDKAMRVRGIASTDNAIKSVALRAALREQWVRYLQRFEGGRFLPRGRVTSIEPSKDGVAPAGPAAPAVPAAPPPPEGPASP
ncbi:MAG: mechanosensitive ion channel [Polyangiaceae bacterium]